MTKPLTITASWQRPAISKRHPTTVLMLTVNAPELVLRERATVDVAFSLDRSGSMSGDKIALAKEAVRQAVHYLDRKDRVALVVFDDRVETVTGIGAADTQHLASMNGSLRHIDARGSTDLCGGWLSACRELTADDEVIVFGEDGNPEPPMRPTFPPNRLKRALLLTDGLANVGETSISRLTKHASELRKRGITTSTLGIGDGFDETLLASMAESGGGNFQYIASAADLPAFFQKEIGDLTTTAAASVNLRMSFPEGFHGQVVSSLPVRREGPDFEITVGHMPSGDEVMIVIEVERQRGAPADPAHFILTANWIDPANDKQCKQTVAIAPLETVSTAKLEKMAIDAEVAEQAALQQAARIQRDAMRLDREGDYRRSREMHQVARKHLMSAPATDRVSLRLAEADIYANYDDSRSYEESVRKQSVHNTYRRGRGRADDR